MKKMILAATAALAMLASCNKHTDEIADSATGSVVKITLTDKTPETRAFFDQTAAAESWEKKIGTLTLFVFDGNGDAVLQRNFTAAEISGQTATIPVPDAAPGQTYSFYAIANGSALSGIGTLDDLRSQAESEIADYNGTFDEVTTKAKRSAGFTMTGSATKAIAAAGQTTTVQIALERLVSKVAVQPRPTVSSPRLIRVACGSPRRPFPVRHPRPPISTSARRIPEEPRTANIPGEPCLCSQHRLSAIRRQRKSRAGNMPICSISTAMRTTWLPRAYC